MFDIKTLSVSELTQQIKSLLENRFPYVIVKGEVSNFKKHSSGHVYFTLKDQYSQIFCVIWRSNAGRLKFDMENGLKVIVQGKIAVYEKGGSYQINSYEVFPAGLGELNLAFEQLKNKLKDKGYFKEERKREIPLYPKKIGVVTSPTGAAVRDIIRVARRRSPGVEIILRPVKVQGDGAASTIAQGIDEMNEYGSVDVIIVGRGGGSLEDLWAFNEEIVAEAIYRSEIPIISAVGHEVDFTIADFTADKRAPTPSAAAEIALKDQDELLRWIFRMKESIINSIMMKIKTEKNNLVEKDKRLKGKSPLEILNQRFQRLDQLNRMLIAYGSHHVERYKKRLDSLEKRLNILDPKDILRRGYSITMLEDGRTIIKDAKGVKENTKIVSLLKNGSIKSIVHENS